MVTVQLFLILLAVCNIAVAVILVYQWKVLSGIAKKLLAFVCLGMVPVAWGTVVIYYDLTQVQSVSFCSKCHIMTKYVDSLNVNSSDPLSAVHYQNNWVPQETACYTCHTQYTMFGPVEAKINGLKHLYVYYIEGAPEKIKAYKRYENRDCLRCHGKAKRFHKVGKHRIPEGTIEKLERNEKSCLEKDCHEISHQLANRKEGDA